MDEQDPDRERDADAGVASDAAGPTHFPGVVINPDAGPTYPPGTVVNPEAGPTHFPGVVLNPDAGPNHFPGVLINPDAGLETVDAGAHPINGLVVRPPDAGSDCPVLLIGLITRPADGGPCGVVFPGVIVHERDAATGLEHPIGVVVRPASSL